MREREVWSKGISAGVESGSKAIGTVWAFGALAAANLGAAVYLNAEILTDDVYRSLLAGQGSGAQIDALLSVARRWEFVGYALGPLALFALIGIMALLVQLALVLLGLRLPLAQVFCAGTLAQYALLLGTLAQVLALATLPEGARTAEQLQTIPGAIGGLFSAASNLGPGLALLLERVTLFDLGWVALFTLALEERGEVPGADSATAVAAVWVLCTLAQWGFWLYLSGLS